MLTAKRVFQRYVRLRGLQLRQGFTSHVDIGGIKLPVKEPERPDLVPKGVVSKWGRHIFRRSCLPSSMDGSKVFDGPRYVLARAPLRLSPVDCPDFSSLCGWEVEYLMITKDTTESDLCGAKLLAILLYSVTRPL